MQSNDEETILENNKVNDENEKVIETTITTENNKEDIKIESTIITSSSIEIDDISSSNNSNINNNIPSVIEITSFTENNRKILESEQQSTILDFNQQVKYKNKNIIGLIIKKSGIIIKINSKQSIYIFQDSIIGCIEGSNSSNKVTLFTCVLKKKQCSIDKEQRKRKLYNFQFKTNQESIDFISIIESTFLNTLPRGNPKNRKIRILINPKSGKKESDSIFKEVEQLFKDSGIQVKITITMEPMHAKKIGFKCKVSKYDTFVFVSGDGLLHEFVNGMLSREDFEEARKVPMALVPAGTGNGIACSIGLQDPMSAALAVIRGYTKPLDVCIVQQPTTSTSPINSHTGNNNNNNNGTSTTTTTTTTTTTNTTTTTDSIVSSNSCNNGITKWCSILSLTWGLVSDVDIESEKYRSLGDLRLIIGAAVRILNLRIYKGKVFFLPAISLDKSQMQSVPKCNFNCEICDSLNSVKAIKNLINGNDNNNEETTTTVITTTTTTSEIDKKEEDLPLSPPLSPSSRSDITMSSGSVYKSLDIGVIPSCKVEHNHNLLNESEENLIAAGWKFVEGEFIGVVASTVSHLASDFVSSPNAHLSDGLIDLIFINNREKLSKASLLSILTDSATGDHLKSDLIHHHKVKALILEPGPQKHGIIAVDGERINYAKTSMENVRGCINLICRSYHK